MSRIGKKEVIVPKNVKVTLTDQLVEVEGPKGKLSRIFPAEINISLNENVFTLTKNVESISARQRYGLSRSLLSNMMRS